MKLVSFTTLGLFAIVTVTFFSGCKSSEPTPTDLDSGITCVDGGLVLPPVVCEAQTIDCGGGYCTDPKYDPNNCGGCGKSCGGTSACCDGTCVPFDKSNCGFCGGVCPEDHPACDLSRPGCVDGNGCASGEAFCSGTCVEIYNDRGNCGACGAACPPGKACLSGVCGDCFEGSTYCNGVCASLPFDQSNCGACGVRCAEGETCLDGVCKIPDIDSKENGKACP